MSRFYVILLLILTGACVKQPESGFGVMRYDAVDDATDSLTLKLEQALYEAAPTDSILSVLDGIKPKKGEKASIIREKTARKYYWRSRLMLRQNRIDSARNYIGQSLAEVDSGKYYYTFRRINTLKSSMESDKTVDCMRSLMNDYDYYKSIGDKAMTASVGILIANILIGSDYPESALAFLAEADSLHLAIGLPKYVARNKINVASAYFGMNRREDAAKILETAVGDSAVTEDARAYNTVLRNLYIYTGNLEYLDEAYRQSMSIDSLSALNAVYEVLLSSHFESDSTEANRGKQEYFARKALGRIPKVTNPGHRSEIYRAASELYANKGMMDSAYFYLSSSMAAQEEYEKMRHSQDIAKMRNVRIVAEHEYKQNRLQHAYTIKLLFILIVVILAVSSCLYVIIRIKQRHRMEAQRLLMEKMGTELDMERQHRQYLALTLAMSDTDKILSSLSEKISELHKEGKLSEKEKKEVDAIIKNQAMHHDDWNKFNELFEKTHPQFESKLREKFPDLSETQVRLAMYVYTGMDNKQIATFLNIKAESVKQARWRLRSKMGLGSDENLEDALRSLVK